MGGTNQSFSSPPPASAQVPSSFRSSNQVRSHVNNNEIHFHDDASGFKVVIPESDYKDEFTHWRKSQNTDLTLHGKDGSGGAAMVHFHAYPGAKGTLEVAISVEKSDLHSLPLGPSMLDLDALVGH